MMRHWLPLALAIAVCPGPFCLPSAAAPANPALDGYADYRTFVRRVEQLARHRHVQAASLGKTLGGREVHLLTIAKGKADAKVGLLIVGNVEAARPVGSELAMRVARRLAEGAESDDAIRELLRHFAVYVIPRPHPDGTEKCFRRPWVEPVGNARKTDDDRDGRLGEDPADDLNGDGWITAMRVHDPAGTWMPHPLDPRVMIEADAEKQERGKFKLYVEGIDDDGDGQFNEDAGDGVALNRNFPFGYPYFKAAAGRHQVSEVETRAVADFLFDHPNIAIVYSFTPEDNLMHSAKPNDSAQREPIKTSVLADDARHLKRLAERYREIVEADDAPASPDGAGSFSKWAYFHTGRWSLSARAWWPPKTDPPKPDDEPDDEPDEEPNPDDENEPETDATENDAESEKPPKAESDGGPSSEDNLAAEEPEKEDKPNDKKPNDKKPDKRGAEALNALRWFARSQRDGWVDWTEVEHPGFPGKRVEVGGFKPFYRLNPPAGELDALAEKQTRFVAELAEWRPQVRIESAKAERLGRGVWRITALVVNDGRLPTAPKMGPASRHVFPLQVQLGLPASTEWIHGHRRTQLDALAADGGHAEQTWLVRLPNSAPPAAKIRVYAPAVGTHEVHIQWRLDDTQ